MLSAAISSHPMSSIEISKAHSHSQYPSRTRTGEASRHAPPCHAWCGGAGWVALGKLRALICLEAFGVRLVYYFSQASVAGNQEFLRLQNWLSGSYFTCLHTISSSS